MVEKLQLWDRLQRVAGDCDAIMHLGDQIYGDQDVSARYRHAVRDLLHVKAKALL